MRFDWFVLTNSNKERIDLLLLVNSNSNKFFLYCCLLANSNKERIDLPLIVVKLKIFFLLNLLTKLMVYNTISVKTVNLH